MKDANPFKQKQFDVEHALSMYANSYVNMPAAYIYDDEAVKACADVLQTCHIYVIGLVPRIKLRAARQSREQLIVDYEVGGTSQELDWKIPPGARLVEEEAGFCVQTADGTRIWASEQLTAQRLDVGFEVLYIGQAFGKGGSRNALDRVLKHETLQKISLQGVPATHALHLLFLEIQPANRMISFFNPFAKDTSKGDERISTGLDKLYNTDEAERITLYEASLIRYFQPRFNKEFKNSFPSTNMKVLSDCYKKDFNAVIAEIFIEELPFRLFTASVPRKQHHIARHDLHSEEARKVFFSR